MRLIYSFFYMVLGYRRIFIFGLCVLWVYPAIARGKTGKSIIVAEQESEDVSRLLNGIVSSGDNQDMPFVILDKKQAKIFLYKQDGRLLGMSPALLGIAIGDNYVPGTGKKKLSEIRPEERTTPAGRFYALLGINSYGDEVLWVNYDMSIAIHAVVTSNPKEHRLERLQSQEPKDHRISWGCINVPKKFYTTLISPLFAPQGGIVYVLPDILTTSDVFGSSFNIKKR
jgi:hypothetical protein